MKILKHLKLTSYIDKSKVPNNNTKLDVEYKTALSSVNKTITVEYQNLTKIGLLTFKVCLQT